jgi:hypothetical protein
MDSINNKEAFCQFPGCNKKLSKSKYTYCWEHSILYNKSMLGKKHNIETRKKISKKLKGRKFTEKHKKKIGDKHRGKIVSQDTRIKQAKSRLKNGKYSKYFPKINNCIDCGKEINNKSKRCPSCANKGILNPSHKSRRVHKQDCKCACCKAKRGEYRGETHPNFKGEQAKIRQKHYCIDCGKLISLVNWRRGNHRCHSCEMKRRHKLGLLIIKKRKIPVTYYCIEGCGKKVSREGNRCPSCAGKYKFKKYGNPSQKEEVKNKIRNTVKAIWERGGYARKRPEHSKKMSGSGSPSWIDGRSYDKYPKCFSPELREKIKKRDHYECQGKDCSMTQEEHYMMYGRDIEVHHIDYNRKNCKEINLITLCRQCNLRANINRDYWQTYYTELIGNKIGEKECL